MAVQEKRKSRIKARHLAAAGMMAVVCVAVFLTWHFNTPETATPASDTLEDASKNLGESRLVNADGTVNGEALDALVDASEEAGPAAAGAGDYFTQARLTREKARDETYEVLTAMVSNQDCDEETRRQASQDIGLLAACISMEANIETLVKAKGFTDCVAVVTNTGASLIVQSDGLEANEVAQLQEIITGETKLTSDKIKIVEKQ